MFERKQIIGLVIVLTFGLSILHLVQFQYQNVLPDNSNSALFAQSSSNSISFLLANQNLLNESSTASQSQLFTTYSSSSISSLSSSSPILSVLSSISPTNTGYLSSQRSKDDYRKLIDLTNFDFIINHKSCHQAPLVLILIHSAPLNYPKRNVIRETWGKIDKRSLLLFMIGSVESQLVQDSLQVENDKFGDIVQGNFLDAYRNLTYKHVMALKWMAYNCPKTKYILKTDDDVFINTVYMYEALESGAMPGQDLLFCFNISGDRVKRTYRSKWRVSTKEYSDKYYPNHCPGFSILYSADVAQKLYLEAQREKYFWIDDVFITGNVASKLNISITSTGNLYLSKLQRQEKLFNGHVNPSSLNFFFTEPNLKEKEIKQMWKIVNNQNVSQDLNDIR